MYGVGYFFGIRFENLVQILRSCLRSQPLIPVTGVVFFPREPGLVLLNFFLPEQLFVLVPPFVRITLC